MINHRFQLLDREHVLIKETRGNLTMLEKNFKKKTQVRLIVKRLESQMIQKLF